METGYKDCSPCLHCTRVQDPQNCENKNCRSWQQWFIKRWDQIRAFPRRQMDDTPPRPVGVPLGGRHYALPHQVASFLQTDPCEVCVCPRQLCDTPCRLRKVWEQTKKEAAV